MRLGPLALALGLLPSLALADPLPVHIAALRGRGAASANAERLQVADAIAAVLAESTPEVLSGTETRTRLEALNPSGMHCEALDCLTTVTLPLHARALVMVRLTRTRENARIEVRVVNLRGEVIAERTEQDLAPTAAELTALARLAGGSIAEAVRAQPTVAPANTAATPATPPSPTPAAPPPEVVSPAPRMPPPVVLRRRMPLVIAGAGAIAVGAAALSVGVAGLAGGERVTQTLSGDRVLVEGPSPLNWVWVGGGVAALGVGTWLLVDGLRLRPVGITAAGLVPLPDGAVVTAAGRF
ncbi:MAG: hypothetical protein U0325_08900 [Polyangiales bacterium]